MTEVQNVWAVCEGFNKGEVSMGQQISRGQSKWYLQKYNRGKVHNGNNMVVVFAV